MARWQGPPLYRPFLPNERRENSDGTYSTELSVTIQLPNGEWVNVPSLWMGPEGPTEFNPNDEEQISQAMRDYEMSRGQTFSRFPSLGLAEQAAIARSQAGGAGAQGDTMGITLDYGGYPATPDYGPMPVSRPGGLGNLGGAQPGFFQGNSFGNILQALGTSLMSSPNNVPFANFGPALQDAQRMSLYRDEQNRTSRQQEEERAAIEQALTAAGIDANEARTLSANPQAAKLRLDQIETAKASEAQQAQASKTVEWLVKNRGLSPEEAAMVAGNSAAMNDYLSPQRSGLMNAGDGMIYDPNSGTWLTAPNREDRAPKIETFYDEGSGQPYNAQWNAETGSWDRIGGVKAPSGMSVTTNPDGTVSVTQGPISGGSKMTEQQSKDSVYTTRAAGALPIIDQMGDSLTRFGEAVGGQAPVVGNYLKSSEFQQAEQAGKEFLQAILRKDTGAAITSEETAEYGSVYLPRPGDGPELLAQKKISRQRALKALAMGLPADIILRLEKSGVDLPQLQGDTPPPPETGKPRLRFNPSTGELE